ncbi:DUF6247 family protein [Streptomyces sp. ISL-66]|uniref:DUF6247 family protein n=1 Tax=Streptomyces sp. ISL-66 TaxID=2819186 RepID=UPI0027E45DC6|nr:DUF6247 family protein [Streptomyces sp. ISL-66]
MSPFEREWATALEESRRTFSLTALRQVVQVWRARMASAPASTRSSPPAVTRPGSWTCKSSGAGADERSAVRCPAVAARREGARRTVRARGGDCVGSAGRRRGGPVEVRPVGRR